MSKDKQANTLNSTARNAIVAAFCDALDTKAQSGSLVTQVCDTARKYASGEAISNDDRASIAQDIGRKRGWKPASFKSRASEVNVILRAYHALPEAIKLLRKETTSCEWHDAMKLARRLNAGDTVSKAVAFAKRRKSKGDGNPIGRLAGALASAFEHVSGAKRRALVTAARALTEAGVLKFTGKNAEKFANA